MKQNLQSRLQSLLLSLPIMVLMIFISTTTIAQVSGTVWQDLPVDGTTLNTYGVQDANELGVEGVTVTVFPGGMSDMTDANGDYSIAGAPAGAVRVEFSWPTLTWLESSPDAAAQNTSVQFVTAPATGTDLGLHNPGDFVNSANPDFVIPGYVNGDPLLGGTSAAFPAIYKVNNAAAGGGPSGTEVANYTNLSPLSAVGSTWGMGVQRSSNTAFAGAFIKRHSGLGTLGTGGIYAIDAAAGGAVTWLDINTLAGVNTGLDPRVEEGSTLPMDKATPNVDLLAFSTVAKRAIGDVDVSKDDQKLHVMDLAGKQLLIIDIATKGLDIAHAIPDPGCSNADYQPFGIGEYEGKIFVGVVCTGETSKSDADVSATIYRLDGAVWTNVLSFPLTFTREDGVPTTGNDMSWEHWAMDWSDVSSPTGFPTRAPSPILSDIDFDKDGAMILGFMDRGGHQIGAFNNQAIMGNATVTTEGYAQGDVYKACPDGAGGWNIENNGSCGGNTSAGAGNNEGPGGGEFYVGNFGRAVNSHNNSAMGGIAYLSGSGRIALSQLDPILSADFPVFAENARIMGVKWVDNTTGAHLQGVTLVPSSVPGDGTLSKAHGMGDLELIGNPAPIEIGNLVWNDTNGNGIQDPGEPGLAGVSVELRKGAAVVATAMTDANGHYIFSNAPSGPGAAASYIYGLTMLVANMEYTLTVPTTFGGDNLATANTGEGSNTDINDSDADTGTGVATVLAAAIPILGANNHTFDFGYGPVPCPPTRCGTVGVVKN